MTSMHPLGDAIAKRRTELGKTRSALSRETGISLSYLKELENGRETASERLLLIIARGLGCELHDIAQPIATPTAA